MKLYRKAVKLLSRREQMDAVKAQIERLLEQSLNEEIPDTYRDEFANLPQLGSDQSGQYINMSPEDICRSLGFSEASVLGLASKRDKYRAYGRWEQTPEATEFWANPPPGRVDDGTSRVRPLRLRHGLRAATQREDTAPAWGVQPFARAISLAEPSTNSLAAHLPKNNAFLLR